MNPMNPMNISNPIKVVAFRKMTTSKLDYYTIWSDYLMLGSMLLLLLYVIGVYVHHVGGVSSGFSIHAQRLRCIVRGILIFTAVNVIAVLLASAHMDSYNFDKRLQKEEHENDANDVVAVPLNGVTNVLMHNFRGHVLPVLLAVLLLFVLKFTARFDNDTCNGYSCAAALIFGSVFVVTYLSVPSKGTDKPGAVFMNKLNAVYRPNYSSLILFLGVLVAGCLAGNLY